MSLDPIVSGEKFRTLFDIIDNGVAIYSSTDGQNFVFTGLNRAGEQMSGVTFREVAGREIRQVFPGVLEMGLYDVIRRVWTTGKPENLSVGKYDDQRLSRYYENRVYRLSDSEVVAVYSDITAQKIAEDRLRTSEERFRTLFETMQEAFALHEVVFDDAGNPVDYRYLEINPAFERLTGLSRDAIIGRRVLDVLPQLESHWLEAFCRVGTTGEPAELENYVKELDRYYRAKAFSPERGKFVAVFEDITDQKRALRALKEREEQLSTILETSQAGIILGDTRGFLTFANRRMAEMLGFRVEELVGSNYRDHVHPDDLQQSMEKLQALLAGKVRSLDNERRYLRKDGTSFWGYLTASRIDDENGNLKGLVGVISDTSDRKRAEEERKLAEWQLAESERRYRSIIENLQDVFYRSDAEGRLTMINPSGVQLFGYACPEEMLGRVIRDTFYFDPAERDAFLHNLKIKGHLYNYEVVLRRKDGSPIQVATSTHLMFDSDGTYCGVEGTFRDISEMKAATDERIQLEKQLLHTQKLESLGVLAGGIAHDFNNILVAIMGNADLALMRLNKESPAVENLHRIEKAAAQAADLAKQMLAYSGKGKFVVESIDLNRLLEEMLHMLEVSISKKAILRLNLTTTMPPVEADATQMRQIIMNLVINASEAIGDRSGVIAITTGCMDCDKNYLKDVWLDENISEGLYVFLEIADTGCGMDKDTLAKIFDPFFTTKFTGRGLGMAAVLGIIRGHRGAVKVYSEVGKGTTFKILLPASGRPSGLFNGDSYTDDWQGSGTVLLVDDEETVRGIGAEMLKELGFSVITADDGRKAVEIYTQTPDIAFVILDLTMPHMDGEQCFRELRQLKPDVRVIMSSGYNEQEVTQKFVGKGLAGFIQKPYKLSSLKDAIRKVL